MTARLRSAAGLSLVEITIILGVMAIISGVLAPSGVHLIGQARDVRVMQDCQAIRGALVSMLNDLGRTNLRVGPGKGTLVELLFTDGAIPEARSDTEALWLRDVEASGTVDLIERHLITNEPAGSSAMSWQPPLRSGAFGWRGAYLRSGVGADPWGRRYSVNVAFLGQRPDVLVISSGPNGTIETPFTGVNLKYGGDDIAVLAK